MIIAVSIVDLHQTQANGKRRHVGTYMLDIPYDAHSHFDVDAYVYPPEEEAAMRPLCGRLLTIDEMMASGPIALMSRYPAHEATPLGVGGIDEEVDVG